MTCTYDVEAVVDLVVGLVVGLQHLVVGRPGGLDNFVCCGQVSCIWYST